MAVILIAVYILRSKQKNSSIKVTKKVALFSNASQKNIIKRLMLKQ